MGESFEQSQEHAVQKNSLATMDSDYLKLKLDTQLLHRDFLCFLKGTQIHLQEMENGNYGEVEVEFGKPRVNDVGQQRLMGLIVSVVNPHTMQGNKTREELNVTLRQLRLTLAASMASNYKEWKLDPDDRELLMESIMTMIELVLSRTIDNLERESHNPTIEKLTQLLTPKKRGL